MSKLAPTAFTAVRQPGIVGLVLFSWAALKHALPLLLQRTFSYVSRGTSYRADVSWKQLASWKTYVAPVLSEGF